MENSLLRPIKFRGKTLDGGEWVYGGGVLSYNDHNALLAYYDETGEHSYIDVQPDTVGQFTGLVDRAGVKIFEGDVVRIANYATEWKHSTPSFDWRIFEVQWNRYLWAFNNSVLYTPLTDYDPKTTKPYDIEVIGNRHDNPELLKEQA